VEPPHDDPEYHLTVDMKDKAMAWIDQHQAFSPDKPFFMYWAPGAVQGSISELLAQNGIANTIEPNKTMRSQFHKLK